MVPRILFLFAALIALLSSGCYYGGEPAARAAVEIKADDLPGDDELREMIDDALLHTYTKRHLNLNDHAAWQILHGALPFGMHYKVYSGDRRVGAVQWVLDGNQMRGWTLRHGAKGFPDGRRGLKVLVEGDKMGQGHEDQWLAVMSQCGLPSDQIIRFQGKEYQIRDVILQAMYDVYEGKECSWTLIGLTNYLPIDTEWKNSRGEEWDIEKIIAMESRQRLSDSACGGTHRLIGMTMALEKYMQQTEKKPAELTGGWREAYLKVYGGEGLSDASQNTRGAVQIAREFQQRDGSFSTNYFTRPSSTIELSLRLNTTGHTLEFLALALDKKQLQEPWVVAAVVELCNLFEQTKPLDLECGSLYHAAHGLIEYRERRFGSWPYFEEE